MGHSQNGFSGPCCRLVASRLLSLAIKSLILGCGRRQYELQKAAPYSVLRPCGLGDVAAIARWLARSMSNFPWGWHGGEPNMGEGCGLARLHRREKKSHACWPTQEPVLVPPPRRARKRVKPGVCTTNLAHAIAPVPYAIARLPEPSPKCESGWRVCGRGLGPGLGLGRW